MPGYDMSTTSGNNPNPSESGYWEFGTDRQPNRPFRINSDGSLQFGDGVNALDTTLARASSGLINVNGSPIPSSASVAAAVAVETARAEAAEALLLPLAGGTLTGAVAMNAGGSVATGQTLTVSGTANITGSTQVGTNRNFNEVSRFTLANSVGGLVDGAVTGVAFDTVASGNNALITQGTAGNLALFTVGATGCWLIEATVRMAAGTTVANTKFEAVLSSAIGSTTTAYDDDAVELPGVSGDVAVLKLSTVRRMTLNDTLSVNAVATGSGVWSINALSERTHVSFTYLGK